VLAVRQLEWQRRPELVEMPAPRPGPGEELLNVDAAGLCHTDLHLMEWPEGAMPYELPFTLGHKRPARSPPSVRERQAYAKAIRCSCTRGGDAASAGTACRGATMSASSR
jgi:hypothetical protein